MGVRLRQVSLYLTCSIKLTPSEKNILYNLYYYSHRHENLEVVKADVTDVESLAPIVEGKNAVMSCLGFHNGTFFTPTTLYSESMTAVVYCTSSSGSDF